MIEQKNKEKDSDLVVVGFKMRKDKAEMLQLCAKALDFKNCYTLFQTVADCILRFAGCWENASRELLDMMYMFDGFKMWSNHARMCVCNVEREVLSAIYLIRESGKNQEPYAEMVKQTELGDLSGFETTTNRNEILIAIFKACDPSTLRRLLKEMKRRHIYSISGVINAMLDDDPTNTDNEEFFKELFNDNERDTAGGTAIVRPEMKKKHTRRDLSSVKEKQLTLFYNSKEEKTNEED